MAKQKKKSTPKVTQKKDTEKSFKQIKSRTTLTDFVYKVMDGKATKAKRIGGKKRNPKEPIEMTQELYRRYLTSTKWADKRQRVINARGCKCEMCGATTHLQVHHKYYKKGKRPWEYPNKALKVLCRDCHVKVHETTDIPILD